MGVSSDAKQNEGLFWNTKVQSSLRRNNKMWTKFIREIFKDIGLKLDFKNDTSVNGQKLKIIGSYHSFRNSY